MSKTVQEEITCPYCGNKQNFTVWTSVNVTLVPELKQKLFSHELITFTCVRCNHSTPVNHSLLYHDMNARFMIWMIPHGGVPKLSDNTIGKVLGETYICRVVRTFNELLEKVLILDNHLDDRVLELFKLLVVRRKAQNEGIPEIKEVRYYGTLTEKDAKWLQFLFVGTNHTATLSLEENYLPFSQYVKDWLPLIAKTAGNWLQIDGNYALSITTRAQQRQ